MTLSRCMCPVMLYGWLVLSGCSVAMAVSGTPEPNFEAFDVGSTRKQVEVQLGPPLASSTSADRHRVDTYQYEIGNVSNGHRALMNFYIDLATIGLWELPATIIEAMMGHQEESKIVYGTDDRALEIQGYRPPTPSQELKSATEAQEQHRKRPPSSNEDSVTPKPDSDVK